MANCCVKNCRSASPDSKAKKLGNCLRFHSIPAWRLNEGVRVAEMTKRRRIAWVSAVRLPEVTFNHAPKSAKVCSLHFLSGEPAYEMSETHPDWAPSLHMGHSEINYTLKAIKTEQKETAIGSRPAAVEETAVDETAQTEAAQTPLEEDEDEAAGGSEIYGSAAKAQLMKRCDECVSSATECDLCVNWCAEIYRLLEENREREKRKLDAQYFKDDDLKVKYYTGLPTLALVMAVLATIQPYLPVEVRALTPFQMLILTLMRLRHNMPIICIAQLFNVGRTTVYRIFSDTLSVLHARLNSLVHWPRREALQRSMPPLFEEAFGEHVAVIVFCLELVTLKPNSLMLNAQPESQSYLHYDRHRSTKYLIGVTPQGLISFISKGWKGRISDKHVTEKCGILDKLLPGDLLLADRGFDAGVGMMCAEVKMSPSFTNRHLDVKAVEATQQMARLRTYVQGVIGTVHIKYTILADKIPLSMVLPIEDEEDMSFLDKMLSVCCALTNLCGKVVAQHSSNY